MRARESKAKKPAERALSPLGSLGRLFNRKTNDRSLKTSSVELSNAAALHVPTVVAQNETDVPGVHVPIVQDEKPPGGAPIVPVTLVEADAPHRIDLKFPEGTLGTEMQSQPLEDLAKAFEDMVKKMTESTGSSVDMYHFIDSITAKASEFSAMAQKLLAAASSVSSKLNETIDNVVAVIEDIASAHPILKISWFIVSAGYKMVSDASKVNKEYLELPGQFQAILEYVSDFLKLPIKGIANVKERSNLVSASESIIICLKDAAVLFTKYMNTSGTTCSNLFGSNKNDLFEMKKRLAEVQEAHEKAKVKGLFTVAVTTASDVADTKEAVYRVESDMVDTKEAIYRVESTVQKSLVDLTATFQSQSTKDSEKRKKDELKKLQDLCPKRDPHSIEVTNLVNTCAKGTRKWIVDQALESIENGEEKITWLRCEAGTGKSVIAALVAQELKQKGLLGATFFCNFKERDGIVCLIQTIAFELADVHDQFRTALIKSLENWGFQDVNENKKAMPNIKKLLQLFIEAPMQAWPKTLSIVVVINALDEISNMSNNIHLLLGTFLSLSSVKLFITSRPEIKAKSIEISTATKKSSVAHISFQQNDERNLEDIRLFARLQVDTLFAEFPDFGLDNKKALEDMLVKKSLGLFIWITLVLGTSDGDDKEQRGKVADYVEESETNLPKASKQQNMKQEKKEQLIKRLEESASMDLQELYCRAFSEAFLDGEQTEKKLQLKLFKASVGTLMVAKVPMSKKGLSSLVQGDNIRPSKISESLDNISALLRVDDNDKLSFIHKTVQDYLIGIALSQDKSRCDNLCSIRAQLSMDDEKKLASIDKTVSDYCEGIASWKLNSHECVKDINFKLDMGEISFNVAMSCLTLLNLTLHKNMAEPKLDSRLNYSYGCGNEWTIDKVSLTESVQYAVLYWSDHFVDAVKMVDAYQQEQLLDELKRFCKAQLLYYLEALLLLKKLYLVPRVVNSVLRCLGDIHYAGTPSAESPLSDRPSADITFPRSNNHSAADNQFISSILRDLKLVSINFRPQLMVSPLQVYNNALIFVPQQSEYYLNYHQMASARITIGAEQTWGPMTLFGHTHGWIAVAISPVCKTIVSGSLDMTVKVWNLQKGTCTRTLRGHSSWVSSVAISPDGRTIVSASYDMTVKVWDMQMGTCTRTLQGLEGHTEAVTSVAISPDGRTIVSGSSDNTVKVWDMQMGTCTRTLEGLEGHTEEVTSVAISPDSRTIVSGSSDNTVKVWDMQKGTCMRTLEGLEDHTQKVNSVAISPDGRTIVSGSSDNIVKVWDVQKGTCIQILESHSLAVSSVAISPDGMTIVSGSLDRTVKVWDMQMGTFTATLEGLVGHSGRVNSFAISPDGRTIVSGSRDKTVKVWDMQKGTCTGTLEGLEGHTEEVNSVAISPDGRSIVSGSSDNTVKVWDMHKGTCTRTLEGLEGHTEAVASVAISPDGRTIVSGSSDKTVKVWDMQKGTCMRTLEGLEGHTQKVASVAISPDGRTIVSGSLDTTVKVWDMQKGTCTQTLEGHSGVVTSLSISRDSRTIVAGSPNNTVKVWGMLNGSDWVNLDSMSQVAGYFALSCERITHIKESVWLASSEALLVFGSFSVYWVAETVAVFADGKKKVAVVAAGKHITAVVMKEDMAQLTRSIVAELHRRFAFVETAPMMALMSAPPPQCRGVVSTAAPTSPQQRTQKATASDKATSGPGGVRANPLADIEEKLQTELRRILNRYGKCNTDVVYLALISSSNSKQVRGKPIITRGVPKLDMLKFGITSNLISREKRHSSDFTSFSFVI
ncbi:hypothetical protein HDU78_005240 [Chytriomyces hyalinus]|nr:hypothetical protein HDU78_005240 [Chytriomyces hyalinus]